MKEYLKSFIKTFSMVLISLFIIIGGFVAYAITFPSGTPSGQITGGNFMNYFNKMLVNTGSTSDGMVKKAQSVSWTGITGMPDGFADGIDNSGSITEIDPKIGTLTNGKWCTSDGTKVNCTSDAPTGQVANLSGIPTSLTLYKWSTDYNNCYDWAGASYDYSLVNAPFYVTAWFTTYFSYNCNSPLNLPFIGYDIFNGHLVAQYTQYSPCGNTAIYIYDLVTQEKYFSGKYTPALDCSGGYIG